MTEKQLELAQLTALMAAQPKSVCFVSGNFNIIHPGHLRFLMFAAEQADILVVGLYHRDYSEGAFLPDEERLLAINTLQIVDHVVMLKDNLETVIDTIKPDVIVKGNEFENRDNVELKYVKSYGGKLLFSSGERTFSSRSLLLAESNNGAEMSHKIKPYLVRNEIGIDDLCHWTQKVQDLHVTVIGDIIIDEYQECLPIGMSQEDPTIAVSPVESFQFLGGAGIVAAHAAGLGATVKLLSVTGDDHLSQFTQNKLQEYGINHHVVQDSTRPTTHKLRYRAKEKTLLRVNNYRKHSIESDVIKDLYGHFVENCSDTDLVVFADFNYGLLCPAFVNKVQKYCQQKNIPVVADSQTSSQLGDLNKFKDLMLTTPTEIEARGAVSDDNSGLVQICTDLGNQLPANNVIITLGSEGSLIHHRASNGWETDKLPALANTAIDTAGAGDALFVTTAMTLTAGANIWQAALLGNISAAIQVNVKGNKPMQRNKLLAHIENLLA